MQESKSKKLLLLGTIIAYALIGIEIVIMISPFALYFYSVYGPILEFFSSSKYLSWTTEFFLPHMIFPDDSIIIGISYLQILFVVGLILFFSAAIPLYYGRFTKKGVVQNSFYSKIRHPQYLFLAISGFGLLLYWPRFIILIMYVTMLFVYYFLARNEEWRMKQEVPEIYEQYIKGTPMFIPGEPGGKIFQAFFGWISPKWLGILSLYVLTMALSIMIALGIRSYTVSQLQVVASNSTLIIPAFPRPQKEVEELYEIISKNPLAAQYLQGNRPPNLAYIFPGDYFLTAIVTDEDRRFSDDIIERFPEVLEWHQHKFRGGLGKFFKIFYNFVSTLGTVETDYDVERLVFLRVTDGDGKLVAQEDVLKLGAVRTPVFLMDLDTFDHEVLTVIEASGNHKWGKMPMPTF